MAINTLSNGSMAFKSIHMFLIMACKSSRKALLSNTLRRAFWSFSQPFASTQPADLTLTPFLSMPRQPAVLFLLDSFGRRFVSSSSSLKMDRSIHPKRIEDFKESEDTSPLQHSRERQYRNFENSSSPSHGFSSHYSSRPSPSHSQTHTFRKDHRLSQPLSSNRNRVGSFNASSRYSNGWDSVGSIQWDNESLMPIRKDFFAEHPDVLNRNSGEIHKFLKEACIKVEGESPFPKPVFNFNEAGFPDAILRRLQQMKLEKPSPVQMIGWPIALSGRDLISIAQTGSGKTFAYLLPAFVHILAQAPIQRGDGPIALVLVPTRELAVQVLNEAEKFAPSLKVKGTAIYGGMPHGPQRMALMSGVDFVVATPGRLLDFISNEAVTLKRTSYLVLDEGDRMLDMGFEPQIRKICGQIRPDKQCLLWSATFPHEIRMLARSLCHTDPVKIQIGSSELQANPDIKQEIIFVAERKKEARFFEWLEGEGASKILVFCETKRDCDNLSISLRKKNHSALAIHGDKTQRERERAISLFHRQSPCLLVATDVAARGLDVSNIDCVVNFGIPKTIEDYIHRIGRTGRAGKQGVAVTFYVNVPVSTEAVRMAKELIQVLRDVGQTIPDELLRLSYR